MCVRDECRIQIEYMRMAIVDHKREGNMQTAGSSQLE